MQQQPALAVYRVRAQARGGQSQQQMRLQQVSDPAHCGVRQNRCIAVHDCMCVQLHGCNVLHHITTGYAKAAAVSSSCSPAQMGRTGATSNGKQE